jgi:hypothetical protein
VPFKQGNFMPLIGRTSARSPVTQLESAWWTGSRARRASSEAAIRALYMRIDGNRIAEVSTNFRPLLELEFAIDRYLWNIGDDFEY